MRTLFFVIAALTVSLVNMNCIWPPIRVALTTSLSLGEYLREGPCQYTCKESGGCNTQLVVDWANVTQKWCSIRIHTLISYVHSTYRWQKLLFSGMQLQRQIVPPLQIIKYAERWLLDAMIATRSIQK